MKIGKPVKKSEIPIGVRRESKYGSIWQAAAGLVDGEALPVEFAKTKEAIAFRANTETAQRLGLHLTLRGTTVYITKSGA
ncbi:hypothetical protein LCGC14_1346220 [marine sediment metagenome]|uniref:Uncharacterized protein n=1 Tax=marine sediment metagenome TaxID=412755 RepID=A0A0F9KYE7_9ZZZZ